MGYVKTRLDKELSDLVMETQSLDSLVREILYRAGESPKITLDKKTAENLVLSAERLRRLAESARAANELLYGNRGRTSLKKKRSSPENGKKGGRPPKEITLARRRVRELEELNFSVTGITDEMKNEHDAFVAKIREWEESKGLRASCWIWG